MTQQLRLLLILIPLLFLAACGGGGDGGGSDEPNVPRPEAIATANGSKGAVEVNAGEGTVHLDGSDSTSPNGAIRRWQWRLIKQPKDSTAKIVHADQARASFTPDVAGEYVIQLTVTDDKAKSEDTQASRVTIKAIRTDPVAVLQDEISWIIGTVQLDGSRSKPPQGGDANQLIYQWELVKKPQGSTATLDSGSLVYPRFTADKTGLYRAQLVVQYGSKTSEPATVDIHIRKGNAEPAAKIEIVEPKGRIMRGDKVVLKSVSTDADGDPLQYRWRFIITPPGAAAELRSATTAKTSFVAGSAAGFGYQVELCVFDGIAQVCRIKFVPSPQVPADASNTPPVAVVGYYSTRHLTFEAEIGAEMRLNSESYDVDGDALTETWSFVSYPEGFNPKTDAKLEGWDAKFTPTVAGEYKVKLTVSDGQVVDTTTQTYTALFGANHSPTAVAAVTAGATTTLVGQPITLDGEDSSDPDDNKLSFDWTIIQRPDGSSAQLQGANTAHSTLTPDKAGPYLVKLVVTDSHGVSSPYRPGSPQNELVIMAKSSNHLPVTRLNKKVARVYRAIGWSENLSQFGPLQPLAITGRLYPQHPTHGEIQHQLDSALLVADTYDPDGDRINHLWTLFSGPAGNQLKGEWTEARVQFAVDVPGTYVFQYQAYDGMGYIGPYKTTVHAVKRKNYPTLLLETVAQATGHAEGSDLRMQATFPWRSSAGPDAIFEMDEGFVPTKFFRLTAFGGDYVLKGVSVRSENPAIKGRFWDVTHGKEITNGHTIPKGSSVIVAFQIASDIPVPSDYLKAHEWLGDARVRGSFYIGGHPDWTVTMSPR